MTGKIAIHRTAIVAPDVEIGDGTIIGPFAVVLGPCSIGRNGWIGPHAVIGTTADHLHAMTVAEVPPEAFRSPDDDAQLRLDALTWFGSHGAGVIIGDRVIIREQSTVHQGTVRPTVIGNDVFVMSGSYVAHDVSLGDRASVGPAAKFGGHAWIGADATVGMASSVHQHRAIGAGAMIGMHATVVNDVGPFQFVKGTPARYADVNTVGMSRLGFSESDINALRHYYDDRGERPSIFEARFEIWERSRAD